MDSVFMFVEIDFQAACEDAIEIFRQAGWSNWMETGPFRGVVGTVVHIYRDLPVLGVDNAQDCPAVVVVLFSVEQRRGNVKVRECTDNLLEFVVDFANFWPFTDVMQRQNCSVGVAPSMRSCDVGAGKPVVVQVLEVENSELSVDRVLNGFNPVNSFRSARFEVRFRQARAIVASPDPSTIVSVAVLVREPRHEKIGAFQDVVDLFKGHRVSGDDALRPLRERKISIFDIDLFHAFSVEGLILSACSFIAEAAASAHTRTFSLQIPAVLTASTSAVSNL